jgi:hypothetical protein
LLARLLRSLSVDFHDRNLRKLQFSCCLQGQETDGTRSQNRCGTTIVSCQLGRVEAAS